MMGIYLTDDVVLVTKTTSATGREATSTNTSIKARFEYSARAIRGAGGSYTNSRAVMYIKPDQDISLGQQVIYEGLTYKVEDITIPKDFQSRYKLVILS